MGNALINNTNTDFGQPIHITFPCAVIPSFYGIIKETINTVAIVLIILRCIYSTLCGNAMGPAWAILKTKCFNIITQFP